MYAHCSGHAENSTQFFFLETVPFAGATCSNEQKCEFTVYFLFLNAWNNVASSISHVIPSVGLNHHVNLSMPCVH